MGEGLSGQFRRREMRLRLRRERDDLALDAAPKEVDVGAVRTWLAARPGVTDAHDLHTWAMSTTETKQQTPTPAEIPFTTPQAMVRYVTPTFVGYLPENLFPDA